MAELCGEIRLEEKRLEGELPGTLVIHVPGGGSGEYTVDGITLKAEDGILAVQTATIPEKDDPRPITSGAVYDEFSKAVALLRTI